ncbi:pilus assembly protein CpaE [Mangrovactinospora gilvigrisea]|uniref:Pilus assembly protein CpaE n=1 Tax=Mangrovactinospora gilvigrisea TaxID=1428644 RepID=A0A1J7BUI9_9ACTN|nr:pilus assembly protein CpaE [Mangrovactinospora gilvigrisea]OIV37129.1 pilus assembly protein CpaE [Mangrovactinospora gilvigrisea]
MLDLRTAERLRRAGLAWNPAPGDRFVIPDRGMDDDVFVISNMTVDLHRMPDDSTVIGFNGTVEWALDSLEKEDALWLPREDQLRDLLGGTFRLLARDGDGYAVTLRVNGSPHAFAGADPEAAYAAALYFLITGDDPSHPSPTGL